MRSDGTKKNISVEFVAEKVNLHQVLMIEKQDFYHGAVLIRLLDDRRCKTISRTEIGYLINNHHHLYPKYTTKSRSPWSFTFKFAELEKLEQLTDDVIVALVCAGDGICSIILWTN